MSASLFSAGLAYFLEKALPDRVVPVAFFPTTKSDLGWAFIGAVKSGRYRDTVTSLKESREHPTPTSSARRRGRRLSRLSAA